MPGKLGARLKNQFPETPDSDEQWAEIAREAHKLTCSAGMLGFAELSGTGAELEAAVHENAPDLVENPRCCAGGLQSSLVRNRVVFNAPDVAKGA